ncbi:hypothetical protein OAO77_00770 [Candidatus Pelagibacter sp.]|nr:hypothetical protein [Candidatus Pelagibacter sp.]
MKKLTFALMMLLGSFSMASAELGVNIGVSGQIGAFTAEAEETMGTTERRGKEDAIGVFGYGSIFLEKDLGQYFTLGIDYVAESLESETVVHTKKDHLAAALPVNVTQTIKVSFEDLTTSYVALNVTENFYVKAGMVTVDVITKETLGTGGTYGNTSLDGTLFGAGYTKDLTNGIFIRAEGTYTEFDAVKINSASGETRFIKAGNIAGASGKLSIGKSF